MLMRFKDVVDALHVLGFHQHAALLEKSPNAAWLYAVQLRVDGSARAVTASQILRNWEAYYNLTMPKMRAVRRLLREKVDDFHVMGWVSNHERRKMEWVLEQLDVSQEEVREMFRCAMTLEVNAISYGCEYGPTPPAYYDDGDFVWMMSEQLSRYTETER